MNRRPSPNPRRAYIRRIRRIAWRREAVVRRRRHIENLLDARHRCADASEFVAPDAAAWASAWLARHRHLLRDGDGRR